MPLVFFYFYEFKKKKSLSCLKITIHQETKVNLKNDDFKMSSHHKNKHQFLGKSTKTPIRMSEMLHYNMLIIYSTSINDKFILLVIKVIPFFIAG